MTTDLALTVQKLTSVIDLWLTQYEDITFSTNVPDAFECMPLYIQERIREMPFEETSQGIDPFRDEWEKSQQAYYADVSAGIREANFIVEFNKPCRTIIEASISVNADNSSDVGFSIKLIDAVALDPDHADTLTAIGDSGRDDGILVSAENLVEWAQEPDDQGLATEIMQLAIKLQRLLKQ